MRFNPVLLESMQIRSDEATALIKENDRVNELYERKILNADFSLQSARELVQIKKTLYYTQFPEFLADKLCPVSSSHHTGSQQVGYDLLEPTGMANIVDDDAQDPPVADIKKEQTVQPVVTIKVAVKWNIQDLRQAQLSQMSGLSANYSFTEEKTRSALIAFYRRNEDIFVRGAAEANVPGFCNNSNLTAVTLKSSAAWETTSPDNIEKTVNEILNFISKNSNSTFLANTFLLPTSLFDTLASKPYIVGTNATPLETVLSFIRRTRSESGQNVEFVKYPYLDSLASADGGKRRIIAYKKDPMILNMEIPQPKETFGPITNDAGMTFRVVIRERHAGVQLRYPVACAYALIDAAA